MESEVFDGVEEASGFGVTVFTVAIRYRLLQRALVDDLVDEGVIPMLRKGHVEDHAADGRFDHLAFPANEHPLLKADVVGFVGRHRLIRIEERRNRAGNVAARGRVLVRGSLELLVVVDYGGFRGTRVLVAVERQVVKAQNHVLGRNGNRIAVGRQQNIVRREHEDARFGLSPGRKRQVDRHLVAVEVRVVRRAHERMQVNRLALDEHRFEGLNSEPVERGGSMATPDAL